MLQIGARQDGLHTSEMCVIQAIQLIASLETDVKNYNRGALAKRGFYLFWNDMCLALMGERTRGAGVSVAVINAIQVICGFNVVAIQCVENKNKQTLCTRYN